MADNRMAVSRRDTDNRMTEERGTTGTRPSRIYALETNLGEDRARGGGRTHSAGMNEGRWMVRAGNRSRKRGKILREMATEGKSGPLWL